MKKILFPILALASLFTSCDMNLEPDGTLPEKEAMSKYTNVEYYRNNFYNRLRGITGGSYVSTAAMQADEFIGVVINGNRLGGVNNGTVTSSDGEFTGFYGSMFGGIASANYFLPYAKAQLDALLDSDEKYAQVRRWSCEALFLRAYCYWFLIDHYCPNYTEATADAPALGMPIVDYYNPTPVASTYPGRSTLRETFAFIENDLDSCYRGLKEFEEAYPEIASSEMVVANAAYISSYAVRALQARVALLKGDYQKAYDYAADIVEGKTPFKVCARLSYTNMWKADLSSELIFRPTADKEEAAAVPATGLAWLSIYNDKCDYIATENALANYTDGADDIRFSTFFKNREINCYSIIVMVPSFTKFPGNPDLNIVSSSNSFKNMGKPFRWSEQCLIMAEAAAALGKEAKANELLRKIRVARITKYNEKYPNDYTGNDLVMEIRLERTRELIGEGFRVSDLRRWGQGFTRSVNYTNEVYGEAEMVCVEAGKGVTYLGNDYRYVWPIPASEFQTNPQMAGQQNPGY